MKMVSAAKYAKAERELKPAKAYGLAASCTYTKGFGAGASYYILI